MDELIEGKPAIEWREAVADIRAELASVHFPAGDVLAFADEFAVTAAHLPYYAAFRAACPECWTIRTFAPWELKLVAEQARLAGAVGDYRYSVRYVDLWADVPPLSEAFARAVRAGYPRAVVFLTPALLRYRRAPGRDTLTVARLVRRPADDEPVPPIVVAALDGNPAWIARAVQIVRASGKTWRQWFAEDGWIPGSRDVGDLQYNYELRWATRAYLREGYEPFGRVMPYGFDYGPEGNDALALELERRWISDEKDAGAMVDRYLRVK